MNSVGVPSIWPEARPLSTSRRIRSATRILGRSRSNAATSRPSLAAYPSRSASSSAFCRWNKLEALDDGGSMTDVARRYGVARQTVHEWLARYAAGGLGGLADRPSRPASCPHQMPPGVQARIVSMRLDHPGWGPSRIRWELERAGVAPLPGRSAV